MRHTLTGLLVLAVCTAAVAAQPDGRTLTAIESKLGRHDVIIARMTIEQDIKILSKPIVSSGHIVVDRRLGVIWQIDAPFSSISMFPLNAGNEQDATAAARLISRLISTIVAGQVDGLAGWFSVSSAHLASDGSFTVTLTPVNATLSRAFSKLELEGGDELSLVKLESANGDTTRYEFSDFRYPGKGAASLADYLPMIR